MYSSFCSVFDAKRLIGRKFDNAEVQSDIKHFPFKVFSKAGKPYIEYRGSTRQYTTTTTTTSSTRQTHVRPPFHHIPLRLVKTRLRPRPTPETMKDDWGLEL